ncbi:MAG: amidohydrolase [Flavobacteriales bacterium]|jgi:predicted amidohydrolase|nr:amidohydrolase [Flavobacteriales bacterium]
MQDLRVTIVQRMLHWEDAEANRSMFAKDLSALKSATDLVVLPEMFTTGFSMRSADLAEPMDGPTVAWMKDQARTIQAAIYSSMIISEGGNHYNRGLFVKPNGGITTYDKRHLFRFANETDHYSAGKERVVVEWCGWRLLLQICFDLRFPVFARNRSDYDAILYVANWPEARRYPWSQLLIARAIENQCYVAGVNRVGMDGKGNHYSGDSVLVDPRGQVIGHVDPSQEGHVTETFDKASLEDFREKFPVALETDDFELKY